MRNKNRNGLLCLSTIVVVIIVYLVIHLFGVAIRQDIYKADSEYENNLPKQPVNNIMCYHHYHEDDEKDKNKIVFEYENNEGNYIYLDNQFPTKDNIGMNFVGDKYTQDFKLKFNNKARGVRYTITAEKLEGSDLDDDWIKAYLSSSNIGIDNCFREDGKVKTFDEYEDYNNNPYEKILYQGVVSADEARRGYKDFTFRMWISEDVSVQNEEYPIKTIIVRVNVYAQK